MAERIKTVDLDLDAPNPLPIHLEGYRAVEVLAWLHGTPVGRLRMPVRDGRCTSEELVESATTVLRWPILRHLLADLLSAGTPLRRLNAAELFEVPHTPGPESLPSATVAVCTRNRTRELARSLGAIEQIEYPSWDIIVIDNAPGGDSTERLVRERFRRVRYIREQRPGLDWARNRAIAEASGEIVAFTDDDAVVDRCWLRALGAIFAEDPDVAGVTGSVVAAELETDGQLYFEAYGGFVSTFERRWHRITRRTPRRWAAWGTGQYGAGANMAFRRGVFAEIGGFDPALDAGTATHGGGDIEMFFRLLKEGHTLVYEPAALARHYHRQTYAELRAQIMSWGTGFFAQLVRSAGMYPDERMALLRLALWWYHRWILGRLLESLRRPPEFPRELILLELIGGVLGPLRYWEARRTAACIAAQFGQSEPVIVDRPPHRRADDSWDDRLAVRSVDLARGVTALSDVRSCSRVEVHVTSDDHPLGTVTLANGGQNVSALRLRDAIVDQLGTSLLNTLQRGAGDRLWEEIKTALVQRLHPGSTRSAFLMGRAP